MTNATYHRTLSIRDVLLFALVASLTFFACPFFDPGWYIVGELQHTHLYARCSMVTIAVVLSVVIAVDPKERAIALNRPGRMAIVSTAFSAFLSTFLNWSHFTRDLYGGPMDAFRFMVFDGVLNPAVPPPIFAVSSIIVFGLLSRWFTLMLDWLEIVGFALMLFWVITSVLHEWLNEWEFICGTVSS